MSLKEFTEDRLSRTINKTKSSLIELIEKVDLDGRANMMACEGRMMEKHKDNINKLHIQKTELTKQFETGIEQERKRTTERFSETHKYIDSNKNLINEHIRQQIESSKALTKAIIAKESAERNKADEEMMSTISDRVEQ
jgi:hypothetical protein